MGKKITSGLRKRGDIWHIEKTVRGHRLFESTGTGNLDEAEKYLTRRMEEIRQATIYGGSSEPDVRAGCGGICESKSLQEKYSEGSGSVK